LPLGHILLLEIIVGGLGRPGQGIGLVLEGNRPRHTQPVRLRQGRSRQQ
jgi:hypothetical protein